MEQIRSFIAIELPAEVKSALARLQARLKSGRQFPLKWVDPHSIHLTLKFLGNVRTGVIEEITGAMGDAASEIPPFHLEIKGLGAFPNLKRVQVAWVGVSGDLDRIIELQKRIEANLSPLGFAPESRPFVPHLTLARIRDRASLHERQGFGHLIAGTPFEAVYGFNAESINLMRSQLTSEGPVYTRINSVKLSGHLPTPTT